MRNLPYSSLCVCVLIGCGSSEPPRVASDAGEVDAIKEDAADAFVDAFADASAADAAGDAVPETSGDGDVGDSARDGEVGDAIDGDARLPLPRRYDEIFMGGDHTCKLVGGRLGCIGANASGELGVPATPFETGWVAPSLDVDRLVMLAIRDRHACALLDAGDVWCWGDDAHGQLGDGKLVAREKPQKIVTSVRFVAVAVGSDFSCALVEDGTVHCWGHNDQGQLGDGTTVDHGVPRPVIGLTGATALALGAAHACAITTSGLACWGRNAEGELGDGTHVQRTAPVSVVVAGKVVTAAASDHATCWASDKTYCVGADVGAFVDSSTPLAIVDVYGGSPWGRIFGGARFFCISAGGYASDSCFGENTLGQIGARATLGPSAGPSDPRSYLISDFEMKVGANHGCMRFMDSFYCWGANEHGQLGRGTSSTFGDFGGTTIVGP